MLRDMIYLVQSAPWLSASQMPPFFATHSLSLLLHRSVVTVYAKFPADYPQAALSDASLSRPYTPSPISSGDLLLPSVFAGPILP
jgi:hypothetical protein